MKRQRASVRGFSLTEVLVTLFLIGILSGIAAGTFRFFTDESADKAGESTLSSVAGAAESYYLQRNVWPSAAALDDLGDDTVSVTDGASDGPGEVSLEAVTFDGIAGIGLAVRIGEECITLLVLPPEEPYESYVERRVLAPAEVCRGESA